MTIKYTMRDHKILTGAVRTEKRGKEIDLLSDFSVVKSHISKLFSPDHEGTETSIA